ncbi:MAG: hypothetical protein ACLSGP_09525 [Faecalibacterium prausnitzii]
MSEGTKRGACPEAPPGMPEANLSTGEAGKSPAAGSARLAVRLAVFAAVLGSLTQVYLVTQASGSEMFPP